MAVSPLASSRARATTRRNARIRTIAERDAPGAGVSAGTAATTATRRRRLAATARDRASPTVPGMPERRDTERAIPPLARGGATVRRGCIATTAVARILAARRVRD